MSTNYIPVRVQNRADQARSKRPRLCGHAARVAPLFFATFLGSLIAGCTSPINETQSMKGPGQLLYESSGCSSCHGNDGAGVVGPALAGVSGTEVMLADGATVTADRDYLIRSILDPGVDVVEGYQIKMPINSLTKAEAEAVASYIQEMK